MRRAMLLIGWAVLATGCAETAIKQTPDMDPDTVIERSDNLDARPDWLAEGNPFLIQEGTVTALGETEIPAGHRVEAGYRIAENNAAAEISGAIQKKLSFIFQNAEEGTGLDETQVRYIGGEASQLVTSAMQTGRRYWEKVGFTNEAGKRGLKYRIFATVEMPELDFRQAIVDAIRRTSGKTGLSEEFAAKVDEHWDELSQAPTAIQSTSQAGIADPEPPAAEEQETAPPAASAPDTTIQELDKLVPPNPAGEANPADESKGE